MFELNTLYIKYAIYCKVKLQHDQVYDQQAKDILFWNRPKHLSILEVVLPNPFRGMGRGGIPRRPNSRATPPRSEPEVKNEKVVPKMARRRGSDVGQSRKR